MSLCLCEWILAMVSNVSHGSISHDIKAEDFLRPHIFCSVTFPCSPSQGNLGIAGLKSVCISWSQAWSVQYVASLCLQVCLERLVILLHEKTSRLDLKSWNNTWRAYVLFISCFLHIHQASISALIYKQPKTKGNHHRKNCVVLAIFPQNLISLLCIEPKIFL